MLEEKHELHFILHGARHCSLLELGC